MNSRKIAAIGATAVVAIALAGCSAGAADESMPVVRVTTASDPSYAPLFIADELGYFEEHGVDVEIVMTEGGPANWNPITAGEVDMGTGSDSTALPLMSQAPDLHAVAAFASSESYVRVVLREGLQTAEDVSVMGASPGLSRLMLDKWLEYNEIDPASVSVVDSTPPELPTLMQRGDIDGFILWEPWPSMAGNYGGHVVADLGDFDMGFTHWVGANGTWLADNEDTARDVLAAVQEGAAYLAENWDEGVELVAKRTNATVEDTDMMLSTMTYEVVSLGDNHLADAESYIDYFIEQGSITGPPNYEEQVHLGFLD